METCTFFTKVTHQSLTRTKKKKEFRVFASTNNAQAPSLFPTCSPTSRRLGKPYLKKERERKGGKSSVGSSDYPKRSRHLTIPPSPPKKKERKIQTPVFLRSSGSPVELSLNKRRLALLGPAGEATKDSALAGEETTELPRDTLLLFSSSLESSFSTAISINHCKNDSARRRSCWQKWVCCWAALRSTASVSNCRAISTCTKRHNNRKRNVEMRFCNGKRWLNTPIRNQTAELSLHKWQPASQASGKNISTTISKLHTHTTNKYTASGLARERKKGRGRGRERERERERQDQFKKKGKRMNCWKELLTNRSTDFLFQFLPLWFTKSLWKWNPDHHLVMK